MQQHQLHILAKNQAELPERVLRVVRHRGFRINALEMSIEESQLQMQLTVSSERPLHLLTSQLEKLVDLRSLSHQGVPVEALRA